MTPIQKPHRSKQDYATPEDFIVAVKTRLHIGAFAFDFAATRANKKAPRCWTEADDSLSKSPTTWAAQTGSGWGWLNPPFGDIAPWADWCASAGEEGASLALLVPASVGANWYLDFVHGRALVLALNGRLAFMPDRPTWLYPKDCLLALYGPRVAPGFDVWSWKR